GYAEMHENEAGTIERMIQRLDAIDYDDPEWGSSFTALEDAVSRHVKEEEGEYFPAACRTLGKRVTEAMTAHYALKRKSIADEMRS
ncbi:MAG: hemerythrin domain-containing protein, partial [Polyangiaceae bacterium]